MAPGKGEDLNHHALEQLPGLAYCINDNPRWPEALCLAFQHHLTMVGTAVLIPLLIIQTNTGVSAPFETRDLVRVIQTVVFVSGINTFLQTTLGTRLPSVMGSSFYFLAPTISIILTPALADIEDPHEVNHRELST